MFRHLVQIYVLYLSSKPDSLSLSYVFTVPSPHQLYFNQIPGLRRHVQGIKHHPQISQI